MFDDESTISQFNEDSVNEIIRQGEIVLYDLIRHNLKHIKHKFRITQNGNYGEFTYAVCLRNGKTEEQMELQAYITTNPKYKFKIDKFHIIDRKLFKLWGYKKNDSGLHFILKNVNKGEDQTKLMDEENVIKYFT